MCARAWIVLLLLGVAAPLAHAADDVRCFPVEFYYRSTRPQEVAVAQALESWSAGRAGVRTRRIDLDTDESAPGRLSQIARYYRVSVEETPILYGGNRCLSGVGDAESLARRVDELLTIDVYTRAGCPHCAAAKRYLPKFLTRYPALRLRYFEITSDVAARDELARLAREYRTAATSVPAFHVCRQLVIGFDDEATSGPRLDKALQRWTTACPATPRPGDNGRVSSGPRTLVAATAPRGPHGMLGWLAFALASQVDEPAEGDAASGDQPASQPGDQTDNELAPLPLPGDEEALPLPPAPGDDEGPPPVGAADESGLDEGVIDLPVFGKVDVRRVGLPLFTIAVGLVDGFNPCAMWVLLFLLSILVNLNNRWRILAVAGSFVVISGAAYFAFMAAWLNVFLFVGLLRPVQVALGLLALFVGVVHVKDYFAFKRGLTLSIPERMKPGIYARVQRIVTAPNLFEAIAGASVLAVLVNIIELLCTGGLPALYTGILTGQSLAAWQNYAYLLLYNVAYMADDSLMVGAVVLTLGKHKLQEREGRALKLISGLVILVIGVVMLVRPEWLF